MQINGSEIAEIAAKSAYDRKALDIVVLDLKGLSSLTDYFVICSGNSDTHVQGIAEIIEESLDEKTVKIWHREGEKRSTWILLDYIDVIVHIFTKEAREFYSLERLWGDAPKTEYGSEDSVET
ncbi:MAG: ribosome silencing factor [Candidatus Poribacteria bacterium]